MNGLKLLATGRCLPKTAVSNEEMSRWVDTSDEWIASRTGIRQRYFCGEGGHRPHAGRRGRPAGAGAQRH